MKTKQRNITLEEANDFDSPVEVQFTGHVTYFHNDKKHGPRVKVLRRTPPAKYHDSGDTPEPVLVPLEHVFKTEVVSEQEADSATPENVVLYLNRALKVDPEAINNLFAHCAPVGGALLKEDEDLPLVLSKEDDGSFTLSVLGIINAMFPFDKARGGGSIVAVWGDEGQLEKFRAVTFRGRPRASD